jgi:hypothetical protein
MRRSTTAGRWLLQTLIVASTIHGVPAAELLKDDQQVRKRKSFAPFYTKTDHFTKTGSGRT